MFERSVLMATEERLSAVWTAVFGLFEASLGEADAYEMASQAEDRCRSFLLTRETGVGSVSPEKAGTL